MRRRDFLSNASLLAAGVSLLSSSCNENKTTEKLADSTNSTITDNFELNEKTIDDLQAALVSGKLSSEQITQLYLKRIEAIDKSGPKLNAVIELNPEAIAIAKQMDAERKAGKLRGAMHGIPVLIKDNIDTADKMKTTAGSLALADHIAARDAFIVKKLREAGAVILGKTNLSEWANFRSSNSSSGWSSRGGQTRNPYYTDRNPCGSSSGSGVAVSANLCAVAVGTETDGSVTCPASVNGVVGIKPTVGLLSRSGIIPISHTQDTAGPLTRTVKDAAILLTVMAGVDAEDAATKESEGKAQIDYTKFLDANGLKGKRIGVEKKKYANQFFNQLQDIAIELMKQQGATIIEISYVDKVNKNGQAEFDVLKYEFKYGLNKYLSTANSSIKSLADVIAFNKANEEKVMPTFKQETLEASEKLGGIDSKEYLAALEKSSKGTRQIIDAVMNENKLDAIAGLTMGPACSIDIIYGDRWGELSLTAPAAMAGYPHISVPCGFVYGLPVGISFFSGAYKEPEIINLAFAFEQAGKHRQLPGFKASFPS